MKNDDFETTDGFDYRSSPGTELWMHGGVIDALEDLTTKSTIIAVTHATGGPAPPHMTHKAGGEADIRAIDASGDPFTGVFYRRLSAMSGMATLSPAVHFLACPLSAHCLPVVADEFTEAMEADGTTELKAIMLGKRWKTADDYSRANTEALIEEIAALTPTQFIYNDPLITTAGIDRIGGHDNHIHFGVNFLPAGIKPEESDGAPKFPVPVPSARRRGGPR